MEYTSLGRVVRPSEVDRAVAKQRSNDRERLFESTHSVVERKPESTVFALVPPSTDTVHEPSTGDLVNGRRLLREHRRRMK